MTKVGVFNSKKKIIGRTEIPSERFENLFGLLNSDERNMVSELRQLNYVKLDKNKLTSRIQFLLEQRSKLPDDTPEYEGKFREDDIFELIEFEGKKLKLCNSGRDSVIVFLINIYEALENSEGIYLFFGKNSREILDYEDKNSVK